MLITRYLLYLLLGIVLVLGIGTLQAHCTDQAQLDQQVGYSCPITIGLSSCCVYLPPGCPPTTIASKRTVALLHGSTYLVAYDFEDGTQYEFFLQDHGEFLEPSMLMVFMDEVQSMYEYKDYYDHCWYPTEVGK